MRSVARIGWLCGLLCLWGCPDSEPASDDDDVVVDDDDSGGDDDDVISDDDDTTADDDDSGADDDDSADDDDATPDESLQEAVSFVYHHSCVGCDGLTIFGLTYSETETIIINISPHAQPGDLFAEERYDAAVRALPLESCAVLGPSAFQIPSVNCLDAGALTFEADWPGWALSPVDYHTVTHNYSSVCCFGDAVSDYAPGRDISVEGAGGAQLGAFVARNTSVEPLLLVSPVVDGDEVPDIDFEQSLDVSWTGGDAETVRIYLLGEWVTAGSGQQILGCHVANDGEFTVPAADLAAFDRGQVVMLHVSDRLRYPLGVSELEQLGWTLGSLTYTYVYYDPQATP